MIISSEIEQKPGISGYCSEISPCGNEVLFPSPGKRPYYASGAVYAIFKPEVKVLVRYASTQ